MRAVGKIPVIEGLASRILENLLLYDATILKAYFRTEVSDSTSSCHYLEAGTLNDIDIL